MAGIGDSGAIGAMGAAAGMGAGAGAAGGAGGAGGGCCATAKEAARITPPMVLNMR